MATVRRPPMPRGFPLGMPRGTVIEPLAFLGRTSDIGARAGVEIWQVVNVLFPEIEGRNHYKMIAALDRRKKMWVGTIDMRRRKSNGGLSYVTDFDECRADFERVVAALDLDPHVVFQISGSALLAPYQGHGVGVAMYLGAAMVAKKEGAAIAADHCFFSTTSDEARRVWASSTFNRHVVRSGLVAAWKG